MKRVWGNERGAVMIVVMIAVVLAGLLFGGLYVTVNASRNQAVQHHLQTQAEFNAQKMMEIALYHYYKKDLDAFRTYFAEHGNCIQDGEDVVCLEQTDMTLTAIGHGKTAGGSYPVREQTQTITYPLTDISSDTERNERGDMTATNGEECLPQGVELPLRALMLGSDVQLDNAMPDLDRMANPAFQLLAKSVGISGGLYLGNNGQIIVPTDDVVNNKSRSASVNIDGTMSPEGGNKCVSICSGNADTEIPGDNEMKVCNIGITYKSALQQLFENYDEGKINSGVNVYKFVPSEGSDLVSFDSEEETLGSRKAIGSTTFGDATEKLSDVLQDQQQKVILIDGNLQLPTGGLTVTNGLLIVYNSHSQATSTIYMTDNSAWQHEGVIATERIGRRTATGDLDADDWPASYALSVNMTLEDVKRYRQP